MASGIPAPRDLTQSAVGPQYFLPEALELIDRVKHRSELSDDEIVMLALTAAQAALVKYVEPGHRSAEKTLDAILSILDHDEVVQATLNKLHHMHRVEVHKRHNIPHKHHG